MSCPTALRKFNHGVVDEIYKFSEGPRKLVV